MFYASDNTGPVHPQIMAALSRANEGYALPYGADTIMDGVRSRIREIFEAPDAAVYLVATGTAANALALATMVQPWQTVFCSPVAHIHEDECNAPEFYTSGAKLTLVAGGDKMSPDALRASIMGEENRGVHGPQRGAVSITQVTEKGGVHSLAQIKALCDVAKDFSLPVHLDGARFANAQAALGCSAAEMTWKAGVDAVSFGATKNGAMGLEAVVFFDPAHAWEFELRRKRGAHLFSKHRYLSGQMEGYLEGDLWLEMARQSNQTAALLAQGLVEKGAVLLHPVEANMIFVDFPRAIHQRLHAAGAVYNIMAGSLEGTDPNEMLTARLVCDWSATKDGVAQFLAQF